MSVWKLTVRHGSDVEHARSTTSMRPWRRCGGGPGHRAEGPCPRLDAARLPGSGPDPRSAAAVERAAAAQAGRRGRRAGGRDLRPLRGECGAGAGPDRHDTPFDVVATKLGSAMSDSSTEIPKGSYAAGQPRQAAGRRRAALHRLHQRRRAVRGRRLRGPRRRDRLHPPDRQGESRHRPLAGDVPRPLRHLPQERDVDLQFIRDGKTELVDDLPVEPDELPLFLARYVR